MRRSFVIIFAVVLCSLSTESVLLGAPTIIPGPTSGSVAGIEDLEVRSDLYNVTFQWNWSFRIWGSISETTFYNDPEGAELAGIAIDEVLNTSPNATLYDPISGANGHSYLIPYGVSSVGWIVIDSHYLSGDGTWVMGHQGWGVSIRTYTFWAVLTWTGNSPPEPPEPPEPPSTIPAPGALLLGGIGAGVVSWLRRRRTL